MRAGLGLLLTTATVVSAPCAWAQTVVPIGGFAWAAPTAPNSDSASASSDAALARAAFTPTSPERAALSGPSYNVAPVGPSAKPDVVAADDGAFVLPAYTGGAVGQARLAASGQVNPAGLAVWSSNEVTLGASAAGVDSVRVSLGAVARPYAGAVTSQPGSLADPQAEAFDLRYIHGWPSALKWSAAGYDVDVTPHAGFGVSSAGGAAEAGAMVRFGAGLGRDAARKLGLHEVDGSSYGGRGRWYLFAAASGQAVGLNMTPGAPGLPRGAWSAESTSALISDAQAGVGWRKGAMQASFGYVHREIKGENYDVYSGPGGPAKISDSMVAFSLSIHPH